MQQLTENCNKEKWSKNFPEIRVKAKGTSYENEG